MTEAYIGIGSNMGDKERNIREAIELIREKCRVIKVSSFYETEPVGHKEQGWFLNCAARIETELKARELLLFLQSIEKKLKRVKTVKNGPRTIDLDILFYGWEVIKEKDLIVPHPRLHKRGFVLEPLKELNPALVHPILKKNVRELFDEVKEKEEKMKKED
ncbi:2-amino-4-hydroxy-6-hydroxymethyldihydropteridine diphosphokinase [Candidatus Woesearchaeota archaeon]|nr:2-amino-4-hydroxy-6-hydroxymethyldihydropteridine diphosphokinase [Candidatus Woesearchaeota archaeon]